MVTGRLRELGHAAKGSQEAGFVQPILQLWSRDFMSSSLTRHFATARGGNPGPHKEQVAQDPQDGRLRQRRLQRQNRRRHRHGGPH